MLVLQIAILLFVLMELSNVIILYRKPDFKYGNSMRVFCAFRALQPQSDAYIFVKYLVNWVANCKLIFLTMLVVVAVWGDLIVLRWAVFATILSIGIFFFTLYPLMKKLDDHNEITPKGYTKTLSMMILSFMLMFTVALIASFIVA